MPNSTTSLEICAGAGGQALGLELAGFEHAAAVEIDSAACATLKANRPLWNVLSQDVRELEGRDYRGIQLFAGGVPCPPFSIAGKQLGSNDDRDLFPTALRLIEAAKPAAVLLENVPGLSTSRFSNYRRGIAAKLERMGFIVDWQVLNACNFGVPQLRPRFILIGLRGKAAERFAWPRPVGTPITVGEALVDLMASGGWRGATAWSERARGIGPTLVGGSKLHGGPDLGPTRARAAWLELSVNGKGVADSPPNREFPLDGIPKLTVRMAARVQGFPDSWQFSGRKTAAYRQIGNAFPPPVAEAVGLALHRALHGLAPAAEPEQVSMPFRIA